MLPMFSLRTTKKVSLSAPVEQLIAHLNAKAVVDALEVVEVETEDGDLLVVGQFADPLLEVADRGQSVR